MKEIMKRLAPALSRSPGSVPKPATTTNGVPEERASLDVPNERRSEPRQSVNSDVILTPLDDVSKRLRGTTLNISDRGMRVRLDRNSDQPEERQVYRIETPTDRMLGEVRNSAVVPASVEVGFEIVSGRRSGTVKQAD